MATDMRLEDFLSAVTDALNQDANADIVAIARRYDLHEQDIESLMKVVQRLKTSLVMVEPSARFVARLRGELIGTEERSWLMSRVRHLPPRVQVAAGAMALFGVLILTRRRLTGFDPADGDISAEPSTAT